MAKAKPRNLRRTISFLSPYLKRHKGKLLSVSLFAVLSALANVIGTYLLRPIINTYIVPKDLQGLAGALVLMGAIYFIGVLSTITFTQLMVQVAQQILFEIRQDLFEHIQTLPMRYLDRQTHGELMSRFTNDIDVLSEGLNSSFTMVIQNFVTIISTFVFMLILNPMLSAIVVGSFLIMFLFLRFTSTKSRIHFADQQHYMAELNGYIEERIEGQKVVQIFNHEEKDLTDFLVHNENLRSAGTSALTYSRMIVPVVVSISYLNYTITTCIGALLAVAGIMDLGTLSSYLVFVRQSALPMNQFSQNMNVILSALAGAEHIYDVVLEPSEVDKGTVVLHEGTANRTKSWEWKLPDGKRVPLRGDVRFEDVTFGYRSRHPVLKNISLYAKPGQKIAFVGSTGAGKTTITNLINRFYEINQGTITYDGIDVRDIQKHDLRRSLSMVLQDTHLFSGTIADNLRYGRQNATREEIVQAAKLANAHSFIRRLPQGYDTLLTGDGENLSQGQRQLLSIARTAVTDPPVLILDEATSSIDTYTEQQVEIGMDHLMEGRTVFVIAHRLSTVRNADAILVLENGEIIERGDHEELVAKKGHYYKLYTGQFELS